MPAGTIRLNIIGSTPEETMRLIITRQDVLDLQIDTPENFKKSLLKEMQFLGLLQDNEISVFEGYIDDHLIELYQFALNEQKNLENRIQF